MHEGRSSIGARAKQSFGDNAELMGAWTSARNVLGPFKSHADPSAGGSVAPGVVKPAA